MQLLPSHQPRQKRRSATRTCLMAACGHRTRAGNNPRYADFRKTQLVGWSCVSRKSVVKIAAQLNTLTLPQE